MKTVRMKKSDIELARLAARVGRHLLSSGRQLVTVESCTGGWIAKVLTDIAGSSQWFAEGYVTYSNTAKQRLGVAPAILKSQGAVSEAVVRAMAEGMLRRTRAQLAVAVSGIAGPGGAVPGKPVGTVWIAWAVRRGGTFPRGVQWRVSAELRHFRGDRESVRRKSVALALAGLLKL